VYLDLPIKPVTLSGGVSPVEAGVREYRTTGHIAPGDTRAADGTRSARRLKGQNGDRWKAVIAVEISLYPAEGYIESLII
jgi:hypothetical protein